MTTTLLILAGILLCVILSGFFSGSEMAYSSCSSLRLEHLRDDGSRRAGVAVRIVERFEDALSATRAAAEEGIVPGGGIALLNVIPKVASLLDSYAGDAKTGVQIILRALEEPIRQIAMNAGIEGSVIVDHIKNAKKSGYGYDAMKGEYVDMVERGIIDPTKVTRSALQNAASIAAMVLTTESLVADIPAPEPAAPAGGAGMGGMY